MKHQRKVQLAEYLLDELGGIDDAILEEATHWRGAKAKRKKPILRALLIAASLSLVLAVGAGSLVTMLLRDGVKAPTADAPAEEVTLTLDALLSQSAESSEAFAPCMESELNYFDGSVRIALQDTQTGELKVSRPLNATERANVANDLRAKGERAEETDTAQAYRVWVLMGDGTVCTPYLSASAGNIGTDLFDYEMERIPTNYFSEVIRSLG